MEKLIFVLSAIATVFYIGVINFLLEYWLAQFFWYPFALSAVLVSLVVVLVNESVLSWAGKKSNRRWVAKIAKVFVFPFALYLGAFCYLMYALLLSVWKFFFLPSFLWNKYKNL